VFGNASDDYIHKCCVTGLIVTNMLLKVWRECRQDYIGNALFGGLEVRILTVHKAGRPVKTLSRSYLRFQS
jgi:hypothetical protein